VESLGDEQLILSVVITCLNAVETLGAQLDALAAQRWSNTWEIVVADGGSTDGTLALLAERSARIARLRVVDASDRPGIAHGLNTAARAANGELFAICEADDEVGAGWVGAVAEGLARHELVACRDEVTKLNEPWLRETRRPHEGLQSIWFPPYLPHASSLGLGVRRELFERIGGFDEAFRALQDVDFCFRAQLAGAELVYLPDAVVHYRYRSSLRGIYRQARLYAECFAQLQRKYTPRGTRLAGQWKWPVTHWRPILREFPNLRSRTGRARIAWGLGWQAGRYKGSLKHRVLAI
jgi:GT2 family glycosyltransferase